MGPVSNPYLRSVDERLSRIEEKLDDVINTAATHRTRIYVWLVVLSLAVGSGYGMGLLRLF